MNNLNIVFIILLDPLFIIYLPKQALFDNFESFQQILIQTILNQKNVFFIKSIFLKFEISISISQKQDWNNNNKCISFQTYIFDLIEQEEDQYIQLLQKNSNLFESSYKNWTSKIQLEEDISTFNKKIKEQIQQSSSKYKIKQLSIKWNVESKEFKSLFGIKIVHIFKQAKYQIAITDNQEIQYTIDGEIRTIQSKQFYLITIDEQYRIKRFRNWSGKYEQNNHKIVKWNTFWQGQLLDNVRGEQKLVLQIDYTQMMVVNQAIGNNPQKIIGVQPRYMKQVNTKMTRKREPGNSFKRIDIRGGEYNCFGEKQGKWVDKYDNFFENSQVIYVGYYNVIGKRIGRWDIFCKYMGQKQQTNLLFVVRGGGFNNEEGNERKIGKWVDLDFYYEKQITYEGEYNQNGLKVGKWDTMNL
ncbi:unnamed protein product [Paramecium sonneborni]|uniref:Uncharacterized protein n=1 Tax=Paramecium sonneborni TaxID=65129 RepID=A0A8S1RMZ4_9CILI|nr:unnamed protein product [Paramecium sonneborni]